MAKLFIEDLELENDTRVRASLPFVRYVLAHGASLVLMSHLGRPDGQRHGAWTQSP
jgi:phosphoglycerate kinase